MQQEIAKLKAEAAAKKRRDAEEKQRIKAEKAEKKRQEAEKKRQEAEEKAAKAQKDKEKQLLRKLEQLGEKVEELSKQSKEVRLPQCTHTHALTHCIMNNVTHRCRTPRDIVRFTVPLRSRSRIRRRTNLVTPRWRTTLSPLRTPHAPLEDPRCTTRAHLRSLHIM